MAAFQLPKIRPDVEETLTVRVDEHVCVLKFRRYGDSEDPFPLYDLEISFDGGPIVLSHSRYHRNEPNFEPLPTMGVGKLLRIIRAVLTSLDAWGGRHPQSFITFGRDNLWALGRILWRKGIISSGRAEQWLAFYDQLGHRVLFKGMLNLIEDKLAVNDLWRVAKDTPYYLGRYRSPVDWLTNILTWDGHSIDAEDQQ